MKIKKIIRVKIFWHENYTFKFLKNSLIKLFLNSKQYLLFFKFPEILSKSYKKENNIISKKIKKKFLFGRLIFFKNELCYLYFENFKYTINFYYNNLFLNVLLISSKHKFLLFLGFLKYIFHIFPVFY